MAVRFQNLSFQQKPEVSEPMWELYKNNIALFWRNRERILSDPKLFYVRTPFSIHAAYIGVPEHGALVWLGALVKAWTVHAEVFIQSCPKCDGPMLVYSFAGSPLTGMGLLSCRCVGCGDLIEHKRHGNFSALRYGLFEIAEQYAAQEIPDALTFEETVALLQKSNI